jgi:origin recognition complex subunit 5
MVDEEQKLDEEEWLEHQMQAMARIQRASSQATVSLLPSLALIPTFLVLASFLASYNPSRLDVRYFLRDDSLLGLSSGSSKRKGLQGGRKLGPGRGRKGAGRGGRRGRPSKTAVRVAGPDGQSENLNRQELLGPRPFAIDRLLAVFQALVTEAAPDMAMVYAALGDGGRDRAAVWEYRSRSLSVYAQINNLVARRMLVRTSAQDKLGTSINFRTNVGYSIAAVLAYRVKFDLDDWLWDWGTGGGNTM